MLRVARLTLLCCCVVGMPLVGYAGPRDETVQILESIPAQWTNAGLEAWLNDGRGASADEQRNAVVLGERLSYGFLVNERAYLTVIHIDAHGIPTVLLPTSDGGHQLAPGTKLELPPDGTAFEAAPPLGREDIFVFATPAPVSLQDLGFSPGAESFPLIPDDEGPRLAGRVKEALAAQPADTVAAARIVSRILGRSKTRGLVVRETGSETRRPSAIVPDYTVEDIVSYFTSRRTRGLAIRSTRLDLHIRFAFGSADLTDQARANLDVVGKAFIRPELVDNTFTIAGHTDDVGSDDANELLSGVRAEAVRRYLLAKHGVAAQRLRTAAYGKTRPMEPNVSDAARAMNRRVEFQLAGVE